MHCAKGARIKFIMLELFKKLTIRTIFRGLCTLLALSTLFALVYRDDAAAVSIASAANIASAVKIASAANIAATQKLIALTFDDGPYTNITGRILDILEKNSVTATFFIIGSRVPGREETLRRIERLGCEIGNHTYSHADLTMLSKARCAEEIELANKEFERVLGHSAELVRPPYGFYNKTVRECVDYPLVLWTVDTNDWKPRNAQELARYVINNVHDESIILMHDEQTSTAAALEECIPALIEMGYRFVTVSELIESCGERCAAIK